MKAYILAVLILIIQSSVFIKYFSVFDFTPDFLTIFLIIYVIRHSFYDSYKFGFFLGFLQDIFSPSFSFFNLVIKTLMVSFTLLVKRFIFVSNFVLQMIIITILSIIDISLKIFFTYLKTGIFYISPGFISYILLNLIIFGVYYIINEHTKG